ncbi:MAG: Sir2 family NAD-dependent protein deacetylase [SAR324 cluster bacterium]|nr:Sir2 family NAD-dependent protein deacetylase [SAR324 cluster bacterium]
MPDTLPFELTPAGLQEGCARVAVITGSGIDAEAGLPTFRGENGYYEDKEATYLASVEALHAEPLRQWRWYLKRFVSYHATLPTASHFALARLESALGERFLGLVTQNVSGLHRKAGSKLVHEINGSIREKRNLHSGERRPLPESWVESPPVDEELCGWRPHVCFIGESYEDYPLPRAMDTCRSCDVALVIGTAGVIHTPVWLAQQARLAGAVVINVNPHPGEVDTVTEVLFRGTAAEYFQEAAAA